MEFPSGELVEMYHNANGITKDGKLDVDILINGNIPTFSSDIVLNIWVCLYNCSFMWKSATNCVKLQDYSEAYIQTGPDSLYAHSDRFYTINDEVMLYTWTHDINYLASRGVVSNIT